jgi:hypothetical protein
MNTLPYANAYCFDMICVCILSFCSLVHVHIYSYILLYTVITTEYGGTGISLADRPSMSTSHVLLQKERWRQSSKQSKAQLAELQQQLQQLQQQPNPVQRTSSANSATGNASGVRPMHMAIAVSPTAQQQQQQQQRGTSRSRNNSNSNSSAATPRTATSSHNQHGDYSAGRPGLHAVAERAANAATTIATAANDMWKGLRRQDGNNDDGYSDGNRSRSSSVNSEEFFDVMANIDESDMMTYYNSDGLSMYADTAAKNNSSSNATAAVYDSSSALTATQSRVRSMRTDMRLDVLEAGMQRDAGAAANNDDSNANSNANSNAVSPALTPTSFGNSDRPPSWAWRTFNTAAMSSNNRSSNGDTATVTTCTNELVQQGEVSTYAKVCAALTPCCERCVRGYHTAGRIVGVLWWPCVKRLITHRDLVTLIRYTHISLSITAVLSVSIIGLGAYVISDMHWVTRIVGWLMWAAVVSVIIGCSLLLLCVYGLQAARRHSITSLAILRCALGISILVLLLCSTLTLGLATGVTSLARVSWNAIADEMPPGATQATFMQDAESKFTALGIGGVIMSLWLMVPFVLVASIMAKLRSVCTLHDIGSISDSNVDITSGDSSGNQQQRQQQQQHYRTPALLTSWERELRRTLRESLLFSVFFTVVCLVYGGHSLVSYNFYYTCIYVLIV